VAVFDTAMHAGGWVLEGCSYASVGVTLAAPAGRRGPGVVLHWVVHKSYHEVTDEHASKYGQQAYGRLSSFCAKPVQLT
jgi:hypothetical protein